MGSVGNYADALSVAASGSVVSEAAAANRSAGIGFRLRGALDHLALHGEKARHRIGNSGNEESGLFATIRATGDPTTAQTTDKEDEIMVKDILLIIDNAERARPVIDAAVAMASRLDADLTIEILTCGPLMIPALWPPLVSRNVKSGDPVSLSSL